MAESVAVLGGGMAGLAAAHYLGQLRILPRVVLMEASHRLGGWVSSTTYPDKVVFEHGPRTLRVMGNAGMNTLALAEDLGLTDKVVSISYSHPSAKNRMLLVDGKLHKLPNSLKTLFTKSPPFSKPLALSALRDMRAPKVINNDESLYSFVNRRFGSEVAKYAIDPMSRGIFAGNAKELSVNCIARRLHDVEQKHGTVLVGLLKDRKYAAKLDPDLQNYELVKKAKKEKWSVWSVTGGLENLVTALEKNVTENNVDIKKNTPLKAIVRSGDKLVIQTEQKELEVNRVISCLPSNVMSAMIQPISPKLGNLLSSIPYVTVGIVNLEFPGHLIDEPGFGYLVPSSEPNRILGVIYDTCTFPQGDRTILTVMMGGYWFKDLFGDAPSLESLLDVAVSEVQQSLKIKAKPTRHHVRILRDCIPQYVVGHSDVVSNARKLIKDLKLPLTLAGSSYDGVGLNDVIMSAKNAVL